MRHRKSVLVVLLLCAMLAAPMLLPGQTTTEERYAVVERTTSQIRFFRLTDNAPRGAIVTGANPNAIAFAPGGRLAYAANVNTAYLSLIDLTLNAEIARIRPVENPYLLALNADGSKLVTTNTTREAISIIDTQTLAVTRVSVDGLIGDAVGQADINFGNPVIAGNKVYFNTNYNVVSVDLNTLAVSIVPGTEGGGAAQRQSMAATPDGQYVVSMRRGVNVLDLISAATGTVIREAPVGPAPLAFNLNPANPAMGYLVYRAADLTAHMKVVDTSESAAFGTVLADVPLGFSMYTAPTASNIFEMAVNESGTVAAIGRRDYDVFPNVIVVDLTKVFSDPANAVTYRGNIPHQVQNVGIAAVAVAPPASAPTVTSVSPGTVVNDTAATLAITGGNFAADARVRIGNLDPLPAAVSSAGSLQVTMPAGTAAQGADIIVTNPNLYAPVGERYQSGILSNAFTIASPATFQPAHQVVAVNEGDSTLSILNASTNTTVAPAIQLDNTPLGFVFSPDGTYAYASTQVPAGIVGADLFHETSLGFVQVNPSSTSLSGMDTGVASGITNGKRRAYVMGTALLGCDEMYCHYSEILYVIDEEPTSATYMQVIGSIDSGRTEIIPPSGSVTITPDGSYVYQNGMSDPDGEGYVNVYDVASGTVAASRIPAASLELDVLQLAWGMTADGKYLLGTSPAGGITVIDITSRTNPVLRAVIPPVTPPGYGAMYLSSPVAVNGRLYAWDAANSLIEIFNFDPANNDFSPLVVYPIPTTGMNFISTIAVTPEGGLIYVPLSDSGNIVVLDTNKVLANDPAAILTTVRAGLNPVALGVRPGTPTELGTGVAVAPIRQITITFAEVTAPGATTVATTNSSPLVLPAGFALGNPPVYYEVATTASFSGPVEVCIHYDPAQFTGAEEELRLLHEEGTGFVDVTTSQDPTTHTICGEVDHFSTFTIGIGSTLYLFDALIQAIQSLDAKTGARMELLAQARVARLQWQLQHNQQAVHQLEVLIDKIEKLSGKRSSISEEDAARLKALAQDIIHRLM